MIEIQGSGRFACGEGEPNHYEEHLRVPALSVGTYSVRRDGADDQRPHEQDEVYVVVAGRAVLETDAERRPVGPGSVVYVPAHEPHRFVELAEDLTLLVLFAPPYGPAGGGG